MKRAVFQVIRGKGNTSTLTGADIFKISENQITNGVSGTFTTVDNKIITVENGIITKIDF